MNMSRRSGLTGKDKTWNRDAQTEYGTGMRDWEMQNWQFNVNKESSNVNFR